MSMGTPQPPHDRLTERLPGTFRSTASEDRERELQVVIVLTDLGGKCLLCTCYCMLADHKDIVLIRCGRHLV
jgi:hypothetical protein